MTTAQLKERLLDVKGPVDVEFEHILLRLFGTMVQLESSDPSSNFSYQVDLCKLLRKALAVLENKIAVFFGREYRGRTGGEVLVELAAFGVELLNRKGSDEDVRTSVNFHFDEIKKAHKSLPTDPMLLQRPKAESKDHSKGTAPALA